MKYIDEFLEYLEVVKKHSENTIRNYKTDIISFMEFNNNNILNISKDDINNYLKHLYDENKSKTSISRILSSLRTFYNYLLKKEYVDTNYFETIKNPKKKI